MLQGLILGALAAWPKAACAMAARYTRQGRVRVIGAPGAAAGFEL